MELNENTLLKIDNLIEERAHLNTIRANKSLASGLTKVGNKLPGWLGGNSLKAAGASIRKNRQNMATQAMKARQEGSVGRTAAKEIINRNMIPEVYQGGRKKGQARDLFKAGESHMVLPEAQKMSRGGWFSNPMNTNDIKSEIERNPNFYSRNISKLDKYKMPGDDLNGFNLNKIPTYGKYNKTPDFNLNDINTKDYKNPVNYWTEAPQPTSNKKPNTNALDPNEILRIQELIKNNRL
jgi:hypothetical protein